MHNGGRDQVTEEKLEYKFANVDLFENFIKADNLPAFVELLKKTDIESINACQNFDEHLLALCLKNNKFSFAMEAIEQGVLLSLAAISHVNELLKARALSIKSPIFLFLAALNQGKIRQENAREFAREHLGNSASLALLADWHDYVLRNGHLNCLKKMLSARFTKDSRDMTFYNINSIAYNGLHMAVTYKSQNIVEFFLDTCKMDPARKLRGQTPLQFAFFNSSATHSDLAYLQARTQEPWPDEVIEKEISAKVVSAEKSEATPVIEPQKLNSLRTSLKNGKQSMFTMFFKNANDATRQALRDEVEKSADSKLTENYKSYTSSNTL